jgi:uncharacterized protein (TIGR03435 family)
MEWSMEKRAGVIRKQGRKSFPPTASFMAFAVMLLISLMAVSLKAQSAPAQSVPAQEQPPRPPTPQWQIDAGGKMEFDVVSVKPNNAGLPPSGPMPYSNIPLGPQDMYSPTGGLLSATNVPLFQYMIFAYKLTPDQTNSVRSHLPKWTTTENFDVQARASGNPTKDQFRLMMQALLADRFKLAIHYETRQLPVLALVLDKPGKLGPHIQPHPDDAPCSTAPPAPDAAPGPPATVAGGFPEPCGYVAGWPVSGHARFGARNVPLAMFATSFSAPFAGVDRPILDKTGLSGKFDFVIEFTPEFNGPLPPGATFQPDTSGPTFQEALKDQLGLKLDSQKGPVDVIVIDHVEQPSEN